MKRAVSVSIGSSKRDKAVEVDLLGETVSIERIGTDGSMEAAAEKFRELDGKVDAFGVGGADLGLMVDGRWYPLHSVKPMVRYVKQTPVVDGTGLKNTLENRIVRVLEAEIKSYLDQVGRRVMVTVGVDRWGMSSCFATAPGYETIFGDLMFVLGIGIPLRSLGQLKFAAGLLAPIVARLPFEWVYPTGSEQEKRTPKWETHYQWATIVSGDCHYVKRHMPDDMQGKIIVTNTTTEADVDLFRQAGVRYLVTTTPRLDGRSFGTNMMEAALVAYAGKGRALTRDELNELLDQFNFYPQIQELN
jgi:hypothetical protein